MNVIIAEKAIAGRRIAEILSYGKAKEQREKGAVFIEFEREGENYVVVPLRGHIMNVDFPKRLDALPSPRPPWHR